MARMSFWLVLGLVATALAGCSGGKPATAADTPEALFALFAKAMETGDYEAAAALVNYDAQASAENENMDVTAKSQRNLIGGKMKEATVEGLKSWGWPQAGMKAEAPVVQGDHAVVVANGGGKAISLSLARGADGWQIVGGVPGMTAAAAQ
ncbi:MAG: hypothetical protein HZB16_24805 [Armatimonadetes bacterium]|nr:hypothetical protein [Armatimonadota bacterium]